MWGDRTRATGEDGKRSRDQLMKIFQSLCAKMKSTDGEELLPCRRHLQSNDDVGVD